MTNLTRVPGVVANHPMIAGDPADRLELRAAGPDDEAVLLAIFAAGRYDHPDIRDRHHEERDLMIRHEFDVRQRAYRSSFPGVDYWLVFLDGDAIGRFYVQRTRHVIFVVDLILLPDWRGHGIGSRLIGGLLLESARTGRTVRLHVEKLNARALALYHRLGFRIIGDARTHHLMEAVAFAR